MQAIATWKGRYEFLLEDGHAHTVAIDLPAGEGGRSAGPPPFDLTFLSLAGSIVTSFAVVAEKRRNALYGLALALEADPTHGPAPVTRVRGTLRVRARADVVEVESALGIALKLSPVAALFARAGVEFDLFPIVVPLAPPSGSTALGRAPRSPENVPEEAEPPVPPGDHDLTDRRRPLDP